MYTVRYGGGDNLDIFSVCTSDIFMFLLGGGGKRSEINLYLVHLYIFFSVTPGLALKPGNCCFVFTF